MFVLSFAAVPLQQGPPTLRSIVPIGTPNVRQLEKRFHRSNAAVCGRIAFIFHKIVLRGSVTEAELWKPT